MTARTGTRWRSTAQIVAICLAVAVFCGALWYRVTYHVWLGLGVPNIVHWCGRDYETGVSGPQTWAQVTAQAPVAVRAVGHYPPLGPGHLLLADPGGVQLDVGTAPAVVVLVPGPDDLGAERATGLHPRRQAGAGVLGGALDGGLAQADAPHLVDQVGALLEAVGDGEGGRAGSARRDDRCDDRRHDGVIGRRRLLS